MWLDGVFRTAFQFFPKFPHKVGHHKRIPAVEYDNKTEQGREGQDEVVKVNEEIAGELVNVIRYCGHLVGLRVSEGDRHGQDEQEAQDGHVDQLRAVLVVHELAARGPVGRGHGWGRQLPLVQPDPERDGQVADERKDDHRRLDAEELGRLGLEILEDAKWIRFNQNWFRALNMTIVCQRITFQSKVLKRTLRNAGI